MPITTQGVSVAHAPPAPRSRSARRIGPTNKPARTTSTLVSGQRRRSLLHHGVAGEWRRGGIKVWEPAMVIQTGRVAVGQRVGLSQHMARERYISVNVAPGNTAP
jgi:hypothetical protein